LQAFDIHFLSPEIGPIPVMKPNDETLGACPYGT